MRKFLTLLLVLCLAAVPCLAETTAHDFGAFTLTFPSDADGQIADEITDNSMFFLIYQDVAEDAQFRPSLNITWMEDVEDVTALDANATAETIMASAVSALEGQGATVTNPQVLTAGLDEVGSKTALSVGYSMDVDYTGMGVDLQVTLIFAQAIVSEEGLGTYTFTITTDDPTTTQPLVDIVNSTVWAK